MADTPTEGGSETAPAPRAPRKPRTASAAKSGASKSGGSRTKSAATSTTNTRQAKSTSANRAPKADATKSRGRTPRKASTAKSGSSGGKATSSAARVAKSVQQGVASVTPSGGKKFAALAAVAGIAAGVATVFGRRKITKAATNAIDAVSGSGSNAPKTSNDSGDEPKG